MILDKHAPRLLGAMFLIVIVASALGGGLLNSAVGSGSISDILVNISKNVTLLRVAILADMVNSLGIMALAVLLYVVLSKQNKIIALVALGWWMAEAISIVISKIGAFALIPLSLNFVQANAIGNSYYETLGGFLYYGLTRQGYTIHMFFYCFGGILWYSLFYRSQYIPRIISLFGLIAVSMGLIGIGFQFFGYTVPIFVYLPLLPFELTIGLWLMLRGIKNDSLKLTFQHSNQVNQPTY